MFSGFSSNTFQRTVYIEEGLRPHLAQASGVHVYIHTVFQSIFIGT